MGALARRYGINQKTVAKWKKRPSVVDLPTGPKEAHLKSDPFPGWVARYAEKVRGSNV